MARARESVRRRRQPEKKSFKSPLDHPPRLVVYIPLGERCKLEKMERGRENEGHKEKKRRTKPNKSVVAEKTKINGRKREALSLFLRENKRHEPVIYM